MENERVLSLVSAEAVLAAVSCVFLQFSVPALNKSLPWGHVHLHRGSSVGKKNMFCWLRKKGILQFGETVRVWIELTPPFLIKRQGNQRGTLPIVTLVYERSLDIAKDSFKLPCRLRNGSKVPQSRAVRVNADICNPICIYLWERIFTSSSAKQLAFFFFFF